MGVVIVAEDSSIFRERFEKGAKDEAILILHELLSDNRIVPDDWEMKILSNLSLHDHRVIRRLLLRQVSLADCLAHIGAKRPSA